MARILQQKRLLIPHATPIVREEQTRELTDSQRQQASIRMKRLFAAYSDDEDDAFIKQRRKPAALTDGPITEGTYVFHRYLRLHYHREADIKAMLRSHKSHGSYLTKDDPMTSLVRWHAQ